MSTETGLETARESAWQRELRVTGRNPKEAYMHLRQEELERAMNLNRAKAAYEHEHSLLNLEPLPAPEGQTTTLVSKVGAAGGDPTNSLMGTAGGKNSDIVEVPKL